jgi:hypothetical protein
MRPGKSGKPPETKWRVSLGVSIENGKRKNPRRTFDNHADALRFCENEKARRVAHGQITAKADGVQVAAWLELDAQLKAAGTKGLQSVGKQALKDALAIHKSATAARCLELFVATLGKSVWADECRTRCGRFVRRFGEGRPISEATPAAMMDYFTQHPDPTGRRTISAWFSWAVEEGFLPSNPCARKRSRRLKKVTKRGEAVILSPPNASALLRAAVQAEDWTSLSFIALGLFAGVRPMEFRKKFKGASAVSLDWSHVKADGIEIGPKIAKTGAGRVVPIQDPLADWIELIRKKRGILAGPLLAVGKRGGGWREHWEQFRANHWPHKWHTDLLRHSYGSYRMAKIKDAERVSHEMGNSPDVVHRHYWNWKTKEADALEFWALTPEVVMSNHHKAASKKVKKPA